MIGKANTPALEHPAPAVVRAPPPQIRALVDEHFGFVARSVRRLGVPEIDVDDVTQDVFLVASNKLDRFVPGNERAFLFGIAMRVASESRRARRRRDARERVAAVAATTAGGPTPEQLASDQQTRVLLDEILDAMPDNVRVVFVLFELEELTMAEIATILNVPPGSVASRLRRGREIFHGESARLRDELGGSS
jgi:RNA polymerase sigma-70 factor (ECF subfamily)